MSVATWVVNICPSKAVSGLPVKVKAASVMVKGTGPAVPPPGGGLNTVMAADPSSMTLAAGTAAVNCMELTKCVANDVPFHLTTEFGTKFEPFTVSENVPLPYTAVGVLEVHIDGTGRGGVVTLSVHKSRVVVSDIY